MKIKCIDTDGFSSLMENKIYDVIMESNEYNEFQILDEDGDEYSYDKCLFEVVREFNDVDNNKVVKLYKPINVKCINNECQENSLKIGKIYTIFQESKFTYVINNYGYNKDRFEVVEEEVNNTDNEHIHSTLNMIKILLENPTYKATCTNQYDYRFIVHVSESKCLTYDDGDFLELIVNDTRKWKIIKPIIKVKFAEAYKIFKNDPKVGIESCLTGKSWINNNRFFEEVTDEEIDDDWIIKIIL